MKIFDGVKEIINDYKLVRTYHKIKMIEKEKENLIEYFYSNLPAEHIEAHNQEIIKKYKGVIPGDRDEETIKTYKLANKQDLFEDAEVVKIFNDIQKLSKLQNTYKTGALTTEEFKTKYQNFIDKQKPKEKKRWEHGLRKNQTKKYRQ